jgi:catechol 2,3-dioxygenase-like lactoylglutathione lyase family enzyme
MSTPVNVKKLGHVVFTVSDIERSTKFWTDIMGFHVSDRNEIGMVFLRNASDHHTMALVPAKTQSELPRKDSPAFTIVPWRSATSRSCSRFATFSAPRACRSYMKGRRGPGCNPGVEFKDPDGFNIELYASMDQIGADGKSRPAEQWSRAKPLEEAVAHPLPGVTLFH